MTPGRIEERYTAASSASRLDSSDIEEGAVHMLVASGIAAQSRALAPVGKVSSSLGHALMRLRGEWTALAKPVLRKANSVRWWTEALPLKNDKRDREGARLACAHQQQRYEAVHAQEVVQLAQRLPSRYAVRTALYALAMHWEWEDADERVSQSIRYWLDPNCHTCTGSGEVMRGERVQTCPDCRGSGNAPMPVGCHALVEYMDNCKAAWIGNVRKISRKIHEGIDTPAG